MKGKKYRKSVFEMSGFTLIELLVVIAIIGLLSSVVLASLNTARAKGRDAKRVSDLNTINTALEFYYDDNGGYPNTGALSTSYWDTGCQRTPQAPDQKLENWIPGLVPVYLSVLPKDPNPKDMARGYSNPAACYMYSGDGTNFVLSAWATVETGPRDDRLYSRAGFRETSITDQNYLCDHPNIGRESSGDYYKYSYTITNVNCTW